jgi:hypothetical protein
MRAETLHRLFGVPLQQDTLALSFVPEQDGGPAANVLMVLRVIGFEYGPVGARSDGSSARAFPSDFDGSMISVEAEIAALRVLEAGAQQYLDGCESTLQDDEELLDSGTIPIHEVFMLEVAAGEKRAATRVLGFAGRSLGELGHILSSS